MSVAPRAGPLNLVGCELVGELSARAAASPRRRANHNLHPELADPVQRFLNAMEPGTYVRPHRHMAPEPKWELFVVLDGEVVVHDAAGLPSFSKLQKRGRILNRGDALRAALELPAIYYAFDLLALEGHDLRGVEDFADEFDALEYLGIGLGAGKDDGDAQALNGRAKLGLGVDDGVRYDEVGLQFEDFLEARLV